MKYVQAINIPVATLFLLFLTRFSCPLVYKSELYFAALDGSFSVVVGSSWDWFCCFFLSSINRRAETSGSKRVLPHSTTRSQWRDLQYHLETLQKRIAMSDSQLTTSLILGTGSYIGARNDIWIRRNDQKPNTSWFHHEICNRESLPDKSCFCGLRDSPCGRHRHLCKSRTQFKWNKQEKLKHAQSLRFIIYLLRIESLLQNPVILSWIKNMGKVLVTTSRKSNLKLAGGCNEGISKLWKLVVTMHDQSSFLSIFKLPSKQQ